MLGVIISLAIILAFPAGMAIGWLALVGGPSVMSWLGDAFNALPGAVRRLSGRQRKLKRKEREAALDKERTEQYRAALEDEWDAKLELHSKWIDEYRKLAGTPHALYSKLPANFYRRRCSIGSDFVVNLCDNPILEMAFATQGEYVCGCPGKKVQPAPGLKQYFRPWNVVELPPRPAIPEMVMPTNKFKKQSNQQKIDGMKETIMPGIVGIRHPLRPTSIKIEPLGFTEAQRHAQETQKRVAEVKAEAELFKSEMAKMQVFYQATEAYRREERQKAVDKAEREKSVSLPHPYANYQPQHHGPWHHSTDL